MEPCICIRKSLHWHVSSIKSITKWFLKTHSLYNQRTTTVSQTLVWSWETDGWVLLHICHRSTSMISGKKFQCLMVIKFVLKQIVISTMLSLRRWAIYVSVSKKSFLSTLTISTLKRIINTKNIWTKLMKKTWASLNKLLIHCSRRRRLTSFPNSIFCVIVRKVYSS